MTRSHPLVGLANVHRVFAARPPVNALRGVDLDVAADDYVAIVGPSGSGKSTLLNILGLLDRPTSGKQVFMGRDIGSTSERDRVRARSTMIGFVLQDSRLLADRTAVENVELALAYSGRPRSGRRALADRALAAVRLGHRSSAAPHTLSGGEQQRVALARAIATEPALILADEPTGNLDRANAAVLLDLIDRLRHELGTTIVVVTHSAQVSERAGRVLELVDGSIRT